MGLRHEVNAMSVTAAGGFRAAGVCAGLKKSGAPDVALVVNDGPLAVAAGVFTANRFKAAPVLWSQQVVADGELVAVVLNSGGALRVGLGVVARCLGRRYRLLRCRGR